MKKVVTISGGTGSFTLLNGLKKYDINITAIVPMTDSGGSSGILRSEFGILPPGDIRRCLIALSESTLMRDLFQYRFSIGNSLKGHSFGNLFLTALKEITGSEEKAILEASEILKIRGKVYPVTLDNVHLHAELENGEIIKGESNIDIPKHNGNLKIKRVFLEPKARAYYNAVKSIEEADLIIIGPGDLYTSIIPCLLVSGIPEAIQNSKAKIFYVCNLMTKFGETNNFTVLDFYNEVKKYLKKDIDLLIFNSKEIPTNVLEKYKQENSFPVKFNLEELNKLNINFVEGDLIVVKDIVRHDSDKLAKIIIENI
ncbi:MAG: gluconeogenesis factor YvcK family protein [Candidatus Heimdallarchaeaceae archaeon]